MIYLKMTFWVSTSVRSNCQSPSNLARKTTSRLNRRHAALSQTERTRQLAFSLQHSHTRKRTRWSNVRIKRMAASEMSDAIVNADVRRELWLVYVPTVGCFCSGGDREGNRAEEASGGLFGCFLRLPLSDVTGNFSHSEAKHFKLSYFVKESYLSKQLVIVGQLIL